MAAAIGYDQRVFSRPSCRSRPIKNRRRLIHWRSGFLQQTRPLISRALALGMVRAFSIQKPMNIEKIAVLLGQLQTLIGVLDQLSPKVKTEVDGALRANGFDTSLIAKNVVKAKQSLQGIPPKAFEPLVVVNSGHINRSAREAMFDGRCDHWGVVIHLNDWGGFMLVDALTAPSQGAPESIKAVHQWAVDRGIQWVKFDCDALVMDSLPRYDDSDVALSVDSGVSAADL